MSGMRKGKTLVRLCGFFYFYLMVLFIYLFLFYFLDFYFIFIMFALLQGAMMLGDFQYQGVPISLIIVRQGFSRLSYLISGPSPWETAR